MAGKKGRSGRKCWAEIRARFNILEWSVINLQKYLQDDTVPLEKRLAAAQPYIIKILPERIQIDQTPQLTPEDRETIIQSLGVLDRYISERRSGQQVITSEPGPDKTDSPK